MTYILCRRVLLQRCQATLAEFAESKFKHTRNLVRELDADGDGIISAAEWTRGLQRMGFPVSSEQAAAVFSALDVQHKGTLDLGTVVSVSVRALS